MILLGGIFLIYKIVTHKGFIRRWESFIEDKFVQSHVLEEGITEDLLHFIEGYGLVRVMITDKSPIIRSSIAEQRLTEKEILVLGIERGKNWIPIPKPKETIQDGDKVVVYGSLNVLKGVFGDR
jgi:Trk K+ transport system NAD-binding subunit